MKGRAFKSITNAARAAAASRESSWVAGGGDPAALHTSIDASAQVRCTICSSACVRRPVCTCRQEEQSDAAREEQSDEAREAAREADKRGKQAARAEQSDEARN